MKKRAYYLLLAVIVAVALALLGIAVWVAVLRPDANYHCASGELPENGFPDCLISSICLLSAALVCFTGSLFMRFLYYDGQKES